MTKMVSQKSQSSDCHNPGPPVHYLGCRVKHDNQAVKLCAGVGLQALESGIQALAPVPLRDGQAKDAAGGVGRASNKIAHVGGVGSAASAAAEQHAQKSHKGDAQKDCQYNDTVGLAIA